MATKIGFKAQPLIDSGGVDWLSVSKDVVKTLTLQEEAREATRVKEQENYAADMKKMVETPLGKDAEANEWLTNGVASISGSAGMDNRLWRSGALSTKDYMRNRANRTQGTDLVLSAFKTYNENYDAVMDGIADGTLAKEKMLYLRAQAESMFDFGKTGIYINPLTSEVNVAKKELVDGAYVMSDNPNEFLNASELMQAASSMYNSFDANKAAASLAESVGQRLIRDGFGNTIESAYMAVTNADKDTKAKIKQARLDQVRGILDDEKAGTYLTDTLNEGFSFTKNPDEAATKNKVMSKMILLNQDGSTTLSKEQMDYAVDKFDTLLEVYLPKEKKAPLPKKPSPSDLKNKKELETNIDLAKTITNILTSSNPTEVKSLLSTLPNFGIDARGIALTNDALRFEVFDKNDKEYLDTPILIDKNNLKGSVEGVLRKLLGQGVDVNEIINKLPSNFFESKNFNNLNVLYKPKEVVEIKEITDPLNRILDPLLEPDEIESEKDLIENRVSIPALMTNIEDNDYDGEELQKVLLAILKKQGIDDAEVIVNPKARSANRMFNLDELSPEFNLDYIIIKSNKYLDEDKKLKRTGYTEVIRKIIEDMSNKRISMETFSGSDSIISDEGLINQTDSGEENSGGAELDN
jgi:hypothetical protein